LAAAAHRFVGFSSWRSATAVAALNMHSIDAAKMK
jgi:hypothetical protein